MHNNVIVIGLSLLTTVLVQTKNLRSLTAFVPLAFHIISLYIYHSQFMQIIFSLSYINYIMSYGTEFYLVKLFSLYHREKGFFYAPIIRIELKMKLL